MTETAKKAPTLPVPERESASKLAGETNKANLSYRAELKELERTENEIQQRVIQYDNVSDALEHAKETLFETLRTTFRHQVEIHVDSYVQNLERDLEKLKT